MSPKRKRRSSLGERLSDWRLSELALHMTEAKARAIVREYTGDEPVTVQWVPDPKVPSCTAIRATYAKGRTLDLIVNRNHIDEVEFQHWPPRSI